MKATSLELRDVETNKLLLITLDADRIEPSWKTGSIVRIDIDDTGTIPESLHGTFEIVRGLNVDIVNLDN